MLRLMLILLVTVFAIDTVASAEGPAAKKRAVSAARQLPPGLPRRHYTYRTTITPPIYRRAPVVVVEPEAPFALFSDAIPYIPPIADRPLLPGSSTIPGYYGRPSSDDYQGPYYGGPYVSYWYRLPYAYGVNGYC
jgi:hypothetical protein